MLEDKVLLGEDAGWGQLLGLRLMSGVQDTGSVPPGSPLHQGFVGRPQRDEGAGHIVGLAVQHRVPAHGLTVPQMTKHALQGGLYREKTTGHCTGSLTGLVIALSEKNYTHKDTCVSICVLCWSPPERAPSMHGDDKAGG